MDKMGIDEIFCLGDVVETTMGSAGHSFDNVAVSKP